MTGSLANAGLIIVGSLVGATLSKRPKIAENKSLIQIMGSFIFLLGIQSAWTANSGTKFVVTLAATVLGALVGELAELESRVEALTQKMERRTKSQAGDSAHPHGKRLRAFLSSSLLFCVGPMAILGALQDGLKHDPSILVSKGILDGVISIALTASLGIGIIFSSISVLIYQGGLTLLAESVQTLMTQPVIDGISSVGGMLLLFMGLNLIGVTKISIVNLLPSIPIGAIAAQYIWK